jgi:hypothetical protein
MTPGREKGADEVFCRSCGNAIKKQAELCPNCGVRNNQANAASGTSGAPPPRTGGAHNPGMYTTTVSDTWWYGIAGGALLWTMLLILAGSGSDLGALGGLLLLGAWVGMPLAGYYDMQYVRANSNWNPDSTVWIVLLALWFVNIVTGAAYLYRRHEVLGEP